MDIASILGLVLGAVFIIVSMLLPAEFNVKVIIDAFVDYASIMITIGGTIASTLVAFNKFDIWQSLKSIKWVFKSKPVDYQQTIEELIGLSMVARKEGILMLEEKEKEFDDSFLKKGIALIVDGREPEIIREVLETDMSYTDYRHNKNIAIWEFVGAQAPSWGMIGTLIGLVMMLKNMGTDSSSIGPNMSLALITTLYGTVVASLIANPIANKLQRYSDEEQFKKELQIEGLMAIQAKTNPRIIEEQLFAYLSPNLRKLPEKGSIHGETSKKE